MSFSNYSQYLMATFLLLLQEIIMEYSINRKPLLGVGSDSEYEDEFETEVDDASISLPDEKPIFKPRQPTDRFHLAYIVFYLLGMNTLIPWSFFVTANDVSFLEQKKMNNFLFLL